MRSFAWKVSLGVTVFFLGITLFMFLSGFAFIPGIDPAVYSAALTFIGVAVALGFIFSALFERHNFSKAHPFVEDFYTTSQKQQARSTMKKGIISGIGLIMIGFASTMLLHSNQWLGASIFLFFITASVFAITYGYLMGSRCNVSAYNQKALSSLGELEIDAIDDEGLRAYAREAKRKRSTYVFVMLIATAIGLLLLFVPQLNAQRWFFLAWIIGGIMYAAISAYSSMRKSE